MYNPSSYGQPAPSQSQANAGYYNAPPPAQGLDFYTADTYTYGGRPSLEASGPIGGVGGVGGAPSPGFGGSMQASGPWYTAFGTGGFEGEPPLLEELGINFNHIGAKSLTVLNPLRPVDARIMDDADLAGPILFCFAFALFLLLSGKPQFSYIYGVALLGSISLYFLLNMMSENGIDAYRVTSVLGYCLLPMVGVSGISVVFTLEGTLGYILSALSILWCTYAASGIFVAVLRMSDQRVLVAYPVGLLYGCFALLSVFGVGTGTGVGGK